MVRRLKINDLKVNLASVDRLLQQAIAYGDPVGELQFIKRKKEIEAKLAQTMQTLDTLANLAVYFGGDPVLGSKGISAGFAGNALDQLQELVSRTYAKNELGNLGERGPIPLKQSTKLMVTEIARGSFGFVLEEFCNQMELHDTKLKGVIEEVATLLERSASPNEVEFEEVLEVIDARMHIALKDFFTNLDQNKATIRIVEEKADFALDAVSIHRARQRIEATSIEESDDLIVGILVGFLPEHRKFELKKDDGEVVYGSVSTEAAKQYSHLLESGETVVGNRWKFTVRRRIVSPLNRPAREIVRLLSFLQASPSN